MFISDKSQARVAAGVIFLLMAAWYLTQYSPNYLKIGFFSI